METNLSSILCIILFLFIGNKPYAQDEGSASESEQFVIREGVVVESSTDFFDSEPKTVARVKAYTLSPDMPNPDLSVEAKGTGNTTGHIANLSVTNKGKEIITISPQTAYIPSAGQYQPYIAYIPETPIPPGTTIIPLNGFCADVQTPPVKNGEPMPPCNKWIPVGNPNLPVPDQHIPVVPGTPVLPFEQSDIPGITSSSNFHPITPDAEAPFIILWPGTDISLGGVFGKEMESTTQAKVLVKALEKITETFDVFQRKNTSPTPFSGDPEKEREAVIQHTFWIYTSGLTGKNYEKENFSKNVHDQFLTETGIIIPKLPDEQRKEFENDIDQFWKTFTAVGVEAKVLSKAEINRQ